jgi:pyrroloquinoline quinone (PQQ) biosynthesis protein C
MDNAVEVELGKNENAIERLNDAISLSRKRLLKHPLYTSIKSTEHLQIFMQSHVYAVWDFMSLLKALQQQLTCTTLPWHPVGDTQLRYLINEIVLAEETDEDADGDRMSHYEMYLDAMQAAGIDTTHIEQRISGWNSIDQILTLTRTEELPKHISQFLQTTFNVIQRGKAHEIAAGFTYGREDLIPEMFTEIIGGLEKSNVSMDLSKIKYYFDRHIELDGDEHGPMAHKMVSLLCENDASKWDEAIAVSKEALESRYELFSGILASLDQ